MIRRAVSNFHRRYRFDELAVDRWRADTGLQDAPLSDLRRRERMFLAWQLIKGTILFPLNVVRCLNHLVNLLNDIERLHGAPRRELTMGRGCVLDRETWLVNASSIEFGDYVKVSAFSALIAGNSAKISIGNYAILGPGVFVVSANHGMADTRIPIRYQDWDEKPVVIGDDVWIGANAVILPGTTIGPGSVIGAGTIVSGDVPAGVIMYQERGSIVMRQRR